jgi:hypothetical protein
MKKFDNISEDTIKVGALFGSIVFFIIWGCANFPLGVGFGLLSWIVFTAILHKG